MGAVPEAVEAALQSMCRGEAAAFTCAAASARGSAGSLVPPPPPSAETVELEVALISMMQARPLLCPPPPPPSPEGRTTQVMGLLHAPCYSFGSARGIERAPDSEDERWMRPRAPMIYSSARLRLVPGLCSVCKRCTAWFVPTT